MARISLRERINKGVFLLDGAMGTELIASGIEAGVCNEYLNIKSPEIIFEIHQAYFRAGSDAVLTNTFGANRFALARHGLGDKVKEINRAAVKIARRAAEAGKYVLGDIGPSGDFLQPLGNLEPEELKNAFVEQAKALSAGGSSTPSTSSGQASSPSVDGFIIETQTSIDEATIAVEAVKQASRDLPVFVSFAFDGVGGDFKTMMGVDVKSAVAEMVSLGVDAVGFNCGTVSLDEYIILAEKFAEFLSSKSDVAVSATAKQTPNIKLGAKRVLLLAEPNAGKPELVDDRTVYKVTPEDFAAATEKIHSAGVNIIGGCCGTGPEYIKVLARKLRV